MAVRVPATCAGRDWRCGRVRPLASTDGLSQHSMTSPKQLYFHDLRAILTLQDQNLTKSSRRCGYTRQPSPATGWVCIHKLKATPPLERALPAGKPT